jgi:hypothetical protein
MHRHAFLAAIGIALAAVVAGSALAATTPKPTITKIAPASATSTSTVTISGAHFTGVKWVKVGGKTATFKVVSPTKITVTLSKSDKSGKISVHTAAGTAMSKTKLVITA